MLLINVHELDVILADPVCCLVLENKVDNIGRILGLERENILALGCAQDLCQGAKIDAESNVTVAAEGRKGLRPQQHGDEGDVRVVHGLERDARVIAIKVAVLDKVFDGVDNLAHRQMDVKTSWEDPLVPF